MRSGPRPIRIGAQTAIPRELISNEIRLVSDLTHQSGARSGPSYYCLAEEDLETDSFLVPRGLDISPYLAKARCETLLAEPLEREYWWPHVEFSSDPLPSLGPNKFIRYDQGPAWRALSAPPAWPWGKILALGCGKGKTFLGLRLACERGVKTIVICHTVAMIDTWASLARDLFGIAEEDIGYIRGKEIDWEDKKLVFSTMPGILCREYPEEFFTDFGLVEFDEGDLLGAEKLSRMLPLFLGERVILTATHERRDGMHLLYNAHVGPVCFEDTEPDLEPLCYVMDSPVPVKNGKKKMEGYAWSRFTKRMEPHIPRTVNKLAAYEPRQDWTRDIVRDLLHDGRKILFVGERIESLRVYDEWLKGLDGGFKSGLALGASHMKGQNLDAILKSCDCVWGIKQIAKRGLNEPAFDTLLIEYATFNDPNVLQQITGRVLRYLAGKNDPLVVLLNDPNISCMDSNAQKIVQQLERSGYAVEWYGVP